MNKAKNLLSNVLQLLVGIHWARVLRLARSCCPELALRIQHLRVESSALLDNVLS